MIERIADNERRLRPIDQKRIITKVAISLLRRVSESQDSYPFGWPPLSAGTMPNFGIFRNRVVLEPLSSRPAKRRLQAEIRATHMKIGNLPR